MPGTSIALATYNGGRYLAAQLESLANQTTLPAELVISDDCSTDNTIIVARSFAARAPFPVRIIESESRLGFRDNFMRAAHSCEGALIAFCDQDDIWEPNKIEVMERVFEDPQVLLAYHNATLISAKGATLGKLYRNGQRQRVFEPLTRHPWLVAPGFMQVFRRELTEYSVHHSESYDVDWPGQPLAHDRWFLFLASVFGRVVYVGEPLVRYRQHSGNVYGFYSDERAHFDRLARGVRFIRAAASASSNRAALLRRMQDGLPAERHEMLTRGIVYFSAMRNELETRKAIYTSPTYRARASALYALVRQGSYGRRRGVAGFTWLDLMLDFYLAAPLGPRLRRLLRK
jgi:glycosyltransferase involved in cell wall biosynthesis